MTNPDHVKPIIFKYLYITKITVLEINSVQNLDWIQSKKQLYTYINNFNSVKLQHNNIIYRPYTNFVLHRCLIPTFWWNLYKKKKEQAIKANNEKNQKKQEKNPNLPIAATPRTIFHIPTKSVPVRVSIPTFDEKVLFSANFHVQMKLQVLPQCWFPRSGETTGASRF